VTRVSEEFDLPSIGESKTYTLDYNKFGVEPPIDRVESYFSVNGKLITGKIKIC